MRDAESAAAEAMVGADIAISSPTPAAAAVAAGLERGGTREEGRGIGGALGGVEDQVSHAKISCPLRLLCITEGGVGERTGRFY